MTQLKTNLLKKGKKGFTLTELAIVIAVIAILIAVLVPTFTSVITNAKVTAAAENAHSSITAYTLETYCDIEDGSVIESNGYYSEVNGGAVSTEKYSTSASSSAIYAYAWTQSENESLPTIYFTADYVVANSSLDGFSAAVTTITAFASAAKSAAETADTTYAGTYKYASVTYNSTTHYFTLVGTASGDPASSITYVATITSDTAANTTSYTSSGSSTTVNTDYTVQLYIANS